jgi:hypothetical protein
MFHVAIAHRQMTRLIKSGHRILKLVVLCDLLAAFGLSYGQSSQSHQTFSFPGEVRRVPSVTGQFSAAYKESASSNEDFLFSINDQTGKAIVQHSFARSVEGAWSTVGANLYLNDFLGSTQIDCFVWTPQSRGLSSLTEALLRDPESGPVEGRGAKPPETPQNSRFELTCDGWKSKDKIIVNVEGTTWAGGQFKYKLVYDLVVKRFNWN